MAPKKEDAPETRTRQLAIRLTEAEYARLEKLSGTLTITAVARAAMMAGLDVVERHPGILVGQRARR